MSLGTSKSKLFLPFKLTFYYRSSLILKYNEKWKESDTISDGEDKVTVSKDQRNRPPQGKYFDFTLRIEEIP